jgi:tetratricopeptide (TPR) repeat protein
MVVAHTGALIDSLLPPTLKRFIATCSYVVLGVGVVVAGLIYLGSTGDPDHCGIADDLQRARLLDTATDSASQGQCEPDAEQALDAARSRASQEFADAQVLAAAAASARAQEEEAKKAVARKSDLQAASALTAGLAENSEPTAPHEQLNASLDEITKAPIGPKTVPPVSRVCALGRRMVDAGVLSEAARALGAAAQSSPAEACPQPRKALRAASADAAREERLAATTDGAEAREHHAEALRSDGSSETAKTALLDDAADNDSNLDRVIDWLEGIPDWLSDNWEAILVFLLGLALVGAIAFWALRRLAAASPSARKAMASDGGWGRRVAGLKVAFDDLDGGADTTLTGKDATSLIGQALETPSSSSFVFDRMPASAAGTDPVGAVADLLIELPQGKTVGTVLKSAAPIFAQRSAKVGGRLIPPESGEAAIALTVTAPDGRLKGTVIGERFVNPSPGGDTATRWRQIVPAAAAWIRYELRALSGKQSEVGDPGAWRAEALAEAGKQWSAKQEWERAATCFTRALDADPSLLPALNNLGVVEIRRARYDIAAQHLSKLLEKLGDQPSNNWPALREAALYNLTLAIIYKSAL